MVVLLFHNAKAAALIDTDSELLLQRVGSEKWLLAKRVVLDVAVIQ